MKNKLIIGNLNINSLRNKFDQLKEFIQENIDILVITETKLDASFPCNQFFIPGYCIPFRFDRSSFGGGVIIYVREDIPCKKLTKFILPDDIEGIFIEINLRKVKWLLFGTYHPPSQQDNYYFSNLGKAIDFYLKSYEKFLLVGDFNSNVTDLQLSEFLNNYNAKNLVHDMTCFKSKDNPSCIDLLLTNSPRNFQNTCAITTGLSDFHKMVISVINTSFLKTKHKEIIYRNYKNFINDDFKNDLSISLASNETSSYSSFEQTFVNVLNAHAPLKKKVVRANHAPYVTKKMRKAIMRRTQLQNKYFKNKTFENLRNYKKQKKFCSKLYKKEKRQYYNNLDLRKVTDNKLFWKTIKPLMSDKGTSANKICIAENDKLLVKEEDVANSLNNYFDKAINNLEINENKLLLSDVSCLTDPIDITVQKFRNHPSILSIQQSVEIVHTFDFSEVSLDEIATEVNKLNNKKLGTFNNIPAKHLKESSEICKEYLLKIWNDEILENQSFPDELKLADITPIFKKEDATLPKNYRPVSVLPSVSKVFERIMQKQLLQYIETFLSPYMCGYRKGFSAQIALISLLEKWKTALDEKKYAGAVLMDLSKAFDTINHELMIAKLYAYGFSKKSLTIMLSYFTNRWQRTKVNTTFSDWSELKKGVLQGSVLGPVLFNVFLNDLFYILDVTNVCNYADDTTLHVCDDSLKQLISRLEHDSYLAINWFENNYMKLNTDKCHLMISGHKYENTFANIGDDIIWEENKVELLGITIDRQMNFESHMAKLIAKANNKLSVLTRMINFLDFPKRRILLKSFFESQFNYCSLAWMFHGRGTNNKINHLHERALRMVYNEYEISFEELLLRDNSFTVHENNIKKLMVELYKVVNGLSSQIFCELFTKSNINNNLRVTSEFALPTIRTEHYGRNSLTYFGPLIWRSLPIEIKNSESLTKFQTLIKCWKPVCPCKLCKTYIPELGFL